MSGSTNYTFSLEAQTGSSIFGGFGQNAAYYPLGSAIRPSQPASGSQPAFGSTEAPAFGATSTPAFGATSASAFGATNPLKATASTPVYKYKSDEELRWEAYQLGDKGSGRISAFARTDITSFGTLPELTPSLQRKCEIFYERNKEKFKPSPRIEDYRDRRSYIIGYNEAFHGPFHIK